jgi:hypothetical protein
MDTGAVNDNISLYFELLLRWVKFVDANCSDNLAAFVFQEAFKFHIVCYGCAFHAWDVIIDR